MFPFEIQQHPESIKLKIQLLETLLHVFATTKEDI